MNPLVLRIREKCIYHFVWMQAVFVCAFCSRPCFPALRPNVTHLWHKVLADQTSVRVVPTERYWWNSLNNQNLSKQTSNKATRQHSYESHGHRPGHHLSGSKPLDWGIFYKDPAVLVEIWIELSVAKICDRVAREAGKREGRQTRRTPSLCIKKRFFQTGPFRTLRIARVFFIALNAENDRRILFVSFFLVVTGPEALPYFAHVLLRCYTNLSPLHTEHMTRFRILVSFGKGSLCSLSFRDTYW